MCNNLEYESLRNEIGRNQEFMAKTVHIGVTISSGFVATSFFSLKYGWILTFVPTVIMIPLIIHIMNLMKKSWIIGRYIELRLEPKMGLCWEKFTRNFFGQLNLKTRTKYASTTILPLLYIQIISPLFALLKVSKDEFFVWGILFTLVLIIVLSEFFAAKYFHLSDDVIGNIKYTIKNSTSDVDSNINEVIT